MPTPNAQARLVDVDGHRHTRASTTNVIKHSSKLRGEAEELKDDVILPDEENEEGAYDASSG